MAGNDGSEVRVGVDRPPKAGDPTTRASLAANQFEKPPLPVEQKWQCLVCGYIHSGPEPPGRCPLCGAPRDKFVLLFD